jgi:hypothetical protein
MLESRFARATGYYPSLHTKQEPTELTNAVTALEAQVAAGGAGKGLSTLPRVPMQTRHLVETGMCPQAATACTDAQFVLGPVPQQHCAACLRCPPCTSADVKLDAFPEHLGRTGLIAGQLLVVRFLTEWFDVTRVVLVPCLYL